MAQDIRHVNVADNEGKVFCFKVYEVVEFDGPFIYENCWQCPFWAGLAAGFGVECLYDDDQVADGVETVKFRSPEDAKDRAPKKVSNLESVASKFGIRSMDAREELASKEKIEVKPKEETAPATPETPPIAGGPTTEEAEVEIAGEGKSRVEKMRDDGMCPECGTEMKDGMCPNCGYEKSRVVMMQSKIAAALIPDLGPEMKSLLMDHADEWVDLDSVIEKAKKGDKKGRMSTADPGLFTRCVEMNKGKKGITDVNAYCASVHMKITGKPAGWHAGKNPEGPDGKGKKKKSVVESVVEEVVKAIR